MEKAKVYFSKKITPQQVVEMFKVLNKDLKGKVAVKVHSGEKGNQNYLHPEFFRDIISHVGGTIVECNTAYPGERNETHKHKALMHAHNWTKYFDVDIMDETSDVAFPIVGGKILKENFVGEHILNYDSMLVLSHFKGHPSGGYGGALKQLSIGCASSKGKAWIHSGGKVTDQKILWDNCAEQKVFLASMAESAKSVVDHFKGNVAYVSVMCNMSVDCDCCAVAEDPCMKDIGILSSLDPVALDQACIDLVYSADDPGKHHLIERIESRFGTHTIDVADEIGAGTKEYQLICID